MQDQQGVVEATIPRPISRQFSTVSSDSSSSSSEVPCCGGQRRRRRRSSYDDGFTPLVHRSKLVKIKKDGDLDKVIMAIFCFVFSIFTIVILIGDTLFLPDSQLDWCEPAILIKEGIIEEKEYDNPDAISDPCYYYRTPYLLGFSPFECDFGRRMICSVILGAAIGWERKAADRPAGIRTMSLVSLGSATFTCGGQFAFRSSTMEWDAARVSAAIPSGVGFLGSALIWKEVTGPKGPDQKNHVHGIATAASVWLSASIGIGVGGKLYIMSVWTVVLVLFVLRLVPQLLLDDMEVDVDPVTNSPDNNNILTTTSRSVHTKNDNYDDNDDDNQSMACDNYDVKGGSHTYGLVSEDRKLDTRRNTTKEEKEKEEDDDGRELRTSFSAPLLQHDVDYYGDNNNAAMFDGSASLANLSRHLRSSNRTNRSSMRLQQRMQTPKLHSD